MNRKAIYGLPMNPRPLLEQLAGESFCVNFGTRHDLGSQLNDAIRLVGEDGILLIDNGAFGYHKRGLDTREESYLAAYEAWAQSILDRCPQAIAVIPDVIGGTVEENAELVRTTMLDHDRAMPVWHLHEPISYLLHLCADFGYVAFGSSGEYWQTGTPVWHARIREAFDAIDAWERESNGAYIRPRLHMMRAQSLAHLYPFDSSDSSNVAVNHCRTKAEGIDLFGVGHVRRLADRASAKIRAGSGPESEHQTKRPLLDHLVTAALRNKWALEAARHCAAN